MQTSAFQTNSRPIGEYNQSVLRAIDDRAPSALGWFSVALGAAEVLAPDVIAELAGIKSRPALLRLFGAREIASGIGLLASNEPSKWLWARVAGDLMDLVVLGSTPLRAERGARSKLAAATTSIVGVTAIDALAAIRHSRRASCTVRTRTPREQLVHFISDMYSVEQQALAQLVRAPDIAGDSDLAEDFRTHYSETEQQADLIQERLVAHGDSPSIIKDAIMRLGGKGFLLFAAAMPETPGRLVNHAYSYEAMEWAGYEMLRRFAERAGDYETLEAAESIGAQERAMMERLERGFDAAERASHATFSPETLREHVAKHLAEVHAFETQSMQLLAKGQKIGGHPALESMYRACLAETRQHICLVERRLESLGSAASRLKDAALAAGGINWGLFFQTQSDTPAKFAAFMYAVLHLEIGGCELLKRTASGIGDAETARLCDTLVAEKTFMAESLAQKFDWAVDATLRGK
jgi:ferritin-like metal-binding protein YciE